MSTRCNTKQIEFLPFKSLETSGNSPGSKRTRRVIAEFDSDKVSSDGGVALLREAERRFGVIRRFHGKAPGKIALDIDVTDDPVHGNQEGKFYHGYHGGYCYAPSYIFCGRHLPGCRLREANRDSAAGATEELERIVSQIREKWKNTRITI